TYGRSGTVSSWAHPVTGTEGGAIGDGGATGTVGAGAETSNGSHPLPVPRKLASLEYSASKEYGPPVVSGPRILERGTDPSAPMVTVSVSTKLPLMQVPERKKA